MTAENLAIPARPQRAQVPASMRPRPMTAENRRAPSPAARPSRRFNEAAADDRGKPAAAAGGPGGRQALQ